VTKKNKQLSLGVRIVRLRKDGASKSANLNFLKSAIVFKTSPLPIPKSTFEKKSNQFKEDLTSALKIKIKRI